MSLIHVLDEKTINKIAAGEVIERPASVIKELVENSIDAGAKSIEVEIIDGGIAYIRITDDGCGMEEEDARLAVLRHATSKIQKVEDLFDISSLGFRGEALASISAVSKFFLTTRTRKNSLGTRIIIEGGSFKDCLPFGCGEGTTIEVKDLFFNTPARKKFLKTIRTETIKVQEIIGKLAISHPHIAFKLIVEDKITILTPGNGDISDTVGALYGFKVVKDLFPIIYETNGIFVDGVVGKPSLLKSNRRWQTYIVNNRVIHDKIIMKALDTAYHALLPKGGHPLAVIRVVVPPEVIDINVHPRKNEVKFSDTQILYSAVYRAVLQALEKPEQSGETIATDVNYEKTFARAHKPYQVLREGTDELIHKIRNEAYIPPVQQKYEQSEIPFVSETMDPGIKSYTHEDIDRFRESKKEIVSDYKKTEEEVFPRHQLLPMGQVASCYILAKKGDDLYIIDQHAAHERVRYDKLCKSAESIPMQDLLVPIFIQANDDELTYVDEKRDDLLSLGYDITLAGPTEIQITAMPIDLLSSKAEEVLRFIFSKFSEEASVDKAQLRHEMLAYASCRGAIKAGHNLNLHQMSVLIDDLFKTDKPYVCPHGRPTIVRFTPDELGKLFLRS